MITQANFTERLLVNLPEARGVVDEHLDDNFGELLLHLLMSDLLRLTVASFAAGQVSITDRLLSYISTCLSQGEADVQNAVSVSFVEHFGLHEGETDELLNRWPTNLREELGR